MSYDGKYGGAGSSGVVILKYVDPNRSAVVPPRAPTPPRAPRRPGARIPLRSNFNQRRSLRGVFTGAPHRAPAHTHSDDNTVPETCVIKKESVDDPICDASAPSEDADSSASAPGLTHSGTEVTPAPLPIDEADTSEATSSEYSDAVVLTVTTDTGERAAQAADGSTKEDDTDAELPQVHPSESMRSGRTTTLKRIGRGRRACRTVR